MKIYEFDDYKSFVNAKIKSMPKRGHGQFLKFANLLQVHTTMVTHIFKGDSNLSVEQGLKLANYFGLNELETEYFVSLINLERSANNDSRSFFKKQLQKLKDRALNLKERIEVKKILSEKDQAVFYSAWYFSAIRLLIATEKSKSPEIIADKLVLSLQIVNRVIEFLMSVGLVVEKDGELQIGEARTYVDRDSLFIGRHHTNWRMRALEQINEIQDEELVFTNPITVSEKDFLKIREELVRVIESFRKIADPSPAEKLCCLNIDWVKIR